MDVGRPETVTETTVLRALLYGASFLCFAGAIGFFVAGIRVLTQALRSNRLVASERVTQT